MKIDPSKSDRTSYSRDVKNLKMTCLRYLKLTSVMVTTLSVADTEMCREFFVYDVILLR